MKKAQILSIFIIPFAIIGCSSNDDNSISSTSEFSSISEESFSSFENGSSSNLDSSIEEIVNSYRIRFLNYDQTVLQESYLEEGSFPSFEGDVPIRNEDDSYTYSFKDWNPALTSVTCDLDYTATYDAHPKSQIEDLGVKSIAEVKELCKTLTNLNQSGIAVDLTKKVTIKGLAISKFSLVKSTRKFGLDISSPYKIIFGDESGYIGVSSSYSKDGKTLWGKIGDYAGKETSTYEVTGYLSMYLNKPELYVPDTSFVWNENLDIDISYASYIKDSVDLTSFYEEAQKTNYNCAGHGYGDVYKITNLYCFDKRDNVYFFSDGKQVLKMNKGLTSFSIGYTYDVIGYISLSNWIPSIYALDSSISSTVVEGISQELIIDTTIADFKKNKSSKDDTLTKFDSYISLFKNIYRVKAYVNAYNENGKYYITIGDNYSESDDISSNHLINHISYGEIAISNDNYWNISETQLERYCPLYEYLFVKETVDLYFFPYLQEWGSYGGKTNQPIWKVMLIDDLLII